MNNKIKQTKFIISNQDVNLRIDNFLVNRLNLSKNQVNKLIDQEIVYLNNKIVSKNGTKLAINDEIYIDLSITKENDSLKINKADNPIILNFNDLEVVYDDEYFMVINKPNNLLVYPTKFNEQVTLSHYLENYFKNNNITDFKDDIRKGIVHRLDKQTSGLIIIAKSQDAYFALTQLFTEQKVNKKYTCLVHNCFTDLNSDLKIDTTIGRSNNDIYKMQVNTKKDAKQATTIVHIIKNISNNYALVECQLITGRTHQARVHMRFINHPIVNDPLYGIEKECTDYGQYLYCSNLSFIHPFKNNKINLSLPLPKEFILKIEELENV